MHVAIAGAARDFKIGRAAFGRHGRVSDASTQSRGRNTRGANPLGSAPHAATARPLRPASESRRVTRRVTMSSACPSALKPAPAITCISVIALLWLTTVANFGGPSLTGKIGTVTVWGVIIPVGVLSVIGWFWFSKGTFAAAWNPHGMSLGAGMGSSISLTLWAFLGMESAAQNSSAVENPKRDVPLACLFGTLGAAAIYILSTTVIQGIVPNAELAASTGPFGLAYAHMFNPTIGKIIMALAVMACLGSLLGWQFTLAQTGKSAAEECMFPKLFATVNKMGAPITGMLVLGAILSGAIGHSDEPVPPQARDRRRISTRIGRVVEVCIASRQSREPAQVTHISTALPAELAAAIAEEQELSKKQAEAILNDLVGRITKHLKKGERIRIVGLGILQVRKRAARMGRNPATGEAIQIKASKKVAFRAAKELKEAV